MSPRRGAAPPTLRSALKSNRPVLCGMIHVRALPGTPRHELPIERIVEIAHEEAAVLAANGCEVLIIENMHDAPYLLRDVGPEIVAGMTAAGLAVRQAAPNLPLGVQVLAGANREALAVAQACGASFIRAEGFVFAHVGDEGIHQSDAGELLRYRRAIGADSIAVLTDIKKKHSSHAITADISLGECAHAAEFFGADGVIVTGTATGDPANPGHLQEVRESTGMIVAVGSGISKDNAALYASADMLIVGSELKRGGDWKAPLDPRRIKAIASAIKVIKRS